MPNVSPGSRTGLIMQYLPKYVRPLEDIRRSLGPGLMETFTPELRRRLLADYPYPKVLDHIGHEARKYSDRLAEEERNTKSEL